MPNLTDMTVKEALLADVSLDDRLNMAIEYLESTISRLTSSEAKNILSTLNKQDRILALNNRHLYMAAYSTIFNRRLKNIIDNLAANEKAIKSATAELDKTKTSLDQFSKYLKAAAKFIDIIAKVLLLAV